MTKNYFAPHEIIAKIFRAPSIIGYPELKMAGPLSNAFGKNKTYENWKLFTKQRNLCNKIKRKAKRSYFHKLSTNPKPKEFLSSKDPLIFDKEFKTNQDYMLDKNNITQHSTPISLTISSITSLKEALAKRSTLTAKTKVLQISYSNIRTTQV